MTRPPEVMSTGIPPTFTKAVTETPTTGVYVCVINVNQNKALKVEMYTDLTAGVTTNSQTDRKKSAILRF